MADERRYITQLPDGSFVDADPIDVKISLAYERRRNSLEEVVRVAVKEIEAITETCTDGKFGHRVCYDVAGFPYDVRVCVACGATSSV